MSIEFPRKRALSITVTFLGVIFLFVGAIALRRAPLAAQLFFGVLGGWMVLVGGLRSFARTPRFRANEKGVWFGGGPTIPWSDVKAVFESTVTAEEYKTAGIAFEFHNRSTLWRTPVEHWVSTPFAIGDIDVSPPTGERTTVIASKIEAMRVAAAAPSSATTSGR